MRIHTDQAGLRQFAYNKCEPTTAIPAPTTLRDRIWQQKYTRERGSEIKEDPEMAIKVLRENHRDLENLVHALIDVLDESRAKLDKALDKEVEQEIARRSKVELSKKSKK